MCAARWLALTGFFSALVLQGVFSLQTKDTWSLGDALPPVPTETGLATSALGDEQWLFRRLALQLQIGGEHGGRIVAMRDYDADQVFDWLKVLETLDPKSEWTIGMAARLFPHQEEVNIRRMVDFVAQHVDLDPSNKLDWMGGALYLAEERLDDSDLALKLAYQLASYDVPNMSLISKMYPALILRNRGQFQDSIEYVELSLVDRSGRFSEGERQEMIEFIAITEELAKRSAQVSGPEEHRNQ